MWEYARLYGEDRRQVTYFVFESPAGTTAKNADIGLLAMLNIVGRDRWEVVGGEYDLADYAVNVNLFLKRPV